MILLWDRDPPVADREFLAAFYQVSQSTIRRHCRPVDRLPARGTPRGGGRALYDPFAAGKALKDAEVIARPEQTLAALRRRQADHHQTKQEKQWHR